jgi:hypothetical protein
MMRTYSFYMYRVASTVPQLTFETLAEDRDARALAARRLGASSRNVSIEVFDVEDDAIADRLVVSLQRARGER